MRVTASTNLLLAADAAHRIVTRTVQIKKTADLTEGLFTGTWTDITAYLAGIPSVSQRIEYSPGQFVSDNISLTGNDIEWWKANVFNATDYIELRIRISIGTGSGNMSTDELAIFSGFIDKANVEYNEIADTVRFSVYTADDIGNRISALNINTQYVNSDIDGAGTDGLILPSIPGVFVQDANVTSYVLKVGMHTLVYDYNAGTEQMKLDDGDYVTLPTSDGTVDLVNAAGDEKITLYIDVSALSSSAGELTDYVIVQTAGTTLPRQPYFGLSIGYLLRQLYSQVGITSVTNDTLQFSTHDSSVKHSFYDIPPQDISKTGGIYAMTNDGTDLYIGVGDSVYKRTMSTDTYTLVTTKANYTVKRLWYNSRTNDLWIWFDGASDKYVRLYYLSGGSPDEANVTSDADYRAAELMDFNYTGSSYKYGLVYVNKSGAGDVRFLDGDNFVSDTQLYAATDLGYSGTDDGADSGYWVFIKNGSVWFYATDDLGNYLTPALEFYKISVDATGAWVNDGAVFTPAAIYYHTTSDFSQNAVLHLIEETVYYVDDTNPHIIKSHTVLANTITTVATLTSGNRLDCMLYANGQIYAKVRVAISERESKLYSLDGNTATLLNDDTGVVETFYSTLTYLNSVLYGVDYYRRLWRYSSVLQMYIDRPVWDDTTVKSALNESLSVFNLLGKISSQKKAFIYRRGNDDGDIQTTGNSVAITVSEATDITQVANGFQAVGLVTVSNGTRTVTYNGTSFNVAVLSDVRTFDISSPLIPDALLEDLAVYFYNFYSNDHDPYRIPLNTADIQYEVMDGAAVTFATTRIQKTATGLIMAQMINPDASIECEVLF
ncbi:MAG: hypothetical protein ACYC09_13015 [Bacteroidota bacterium]